jgi:hypothetical protein
MIIDLIFFFYKRLDDFAKSLDNWMIFQKFGRLDNWTLFQNWLIGQLDVFPKNWSIGQFSKVWLIGLLDEFFFFLIFIFMHLFSN